MKNTIFALLLVLTACGSETASEKSLFSKWTKVGSGTTIDISGGSFGTFSMVWGFASGASCTNNVTLTGAEASSTAILTGASYSGGGSGDPGCSSLNGTYKLTKPASVLKICVGTTTTCEEYN